MKPELVFAISRRMRTECTDPKHEPGNCSTCNFHHETAQATIDELLERGRVFEEEEPEGGFWSVLREMALVSFAGVVAISLVYTAGALLGG